MRAGVDGGEREMEAGLVGGEVGFDRVVVVVAGGEEEGAAVYSRIGDGVVEYLENGVGFVGASRVRVQVSR